MKNTWLMLLLFCGCNLLCQTGKSKSIGINLLQLPSTTLNANFTYELKPYFTPLVEFGYTFNFVKGIDLPRPTYSLYDGYNFKNISGGYFKVGGYFNLRKSFKKMNYFHLGLFSSNAWVNEKVDYNAPNSPAPLEKLQHHIPIWGYAISAGFDLYLVTNKLSASVDFQLSYPQINADQLYSFRRFIPGMGYQGTNNSWHPMLILNLKYRLNKARHYQY